MSATDRFRLLPRFPPDPIRTGRAKVVSFDHGNRNAASDGISPPTVTAMCWRPSSM